MCSSRVTERKAAPYRDAPSSPQTTSAIETLTKRPASLMLLADLSSVLQGIADFEENEPMVALLKSLQRKIQGMFDGGSGFTRDMEVGDRVIHGVTQRRGTVTAIQKSKGAQQLTVQLDTGETMHLLDRREFSLCSDRH